MAVKKVETDHFVYFGFHRNRHSDIQLLRADIATCIEMLEEPKDVILDISSLSDVSSLEITIFMQLAQALAHIHRHLRIIAASHVEDVIKHRIRSGFKNVLIYGSVQLVIEDMKKVVAEEANPENPPDQPQEAPSVA